jgi:RNA polymerase sigma-70 factor (ECF subfamily)
MSTSQSGFVELLMARHGRALRSYLSRRLRVKADAPDLAQEVYLRLLRVSDPDAIRDPQHYLYAVAGNLLKERAAIARREAGRVDLDAATIERQLGELAPLDQELEEQELTDEVRAALAVLPPRWRMALILQFRDGLTYQQIGDRIGVSSNMVKKYLAQGLGHLRQTLAPWRSSP